MELTHRVDGEFCVIKIEGNIALDGVGEVKSFVKQFLEDETIKKVIINFEKVHFIDSSGIGLIVSIFKTLQQRGAKLGLSNLSKKNCEIFNMTRLDKILSIYESEDTAIAGLNE